MNMKASITKISILTAVAAIFCLIVPTAHSFDFAEYDPWYYQSTDQGYLFWIPDKVQHCWGSAILNEFGKKLNLPAKEITTPLLTLGIGFSYEVWQERTGIGFSQRDLLADMLGVVSSQFSSDDLIFYMDYSTHENIVRFNVKHLF